MVQSPAAHINLQAVGENAQKMLQRVHPRGLLAVVKWNAYGHGLIECAQALDRAGAAGFGVSSPSDGVALRKAGIDKLILVMTDWVGKPPKLFLDYELEAAATSWYKVEYLEAVSRRLGRAIPAHIKFDTGLGRVGLPHRDSQRLLRKIAEMRELKVAAIYSHLDYSGPQDRAKGERQIEIFNRVVEEARELGISPRWIHLANSAAALALPDIPGNLVRSGIALYGQPPSPQAADLLPLKPVMTLSGQIVTVRRLHRGQGYPANIFFKAPHDGWGAEVNLGYQCGYPRSFAGCAPVLWNGKRVKLIEAMSDNTSYIFCGADKPSIGDEVVFWGQQGGETLFLYELSPLIGCLPYELPTWLSANLNRHFHLNQELK
jgi:alanine racemase